jgi:hypothetical protein
VKLKVLSVLSLAIAACLAMVNGSARGQSGATLAVEPTSQTVGAGSTFFVSLVQDADVNTLGGQATIVFDPAVVQIIDVQPGAAYAGTSLVTVNPLDQEIAEANATGVLDCIGIYVIPGTGSPAGPGAQEFLLLTLQAVPGVTGTAPLDFSDAPCGTGVEGSLGLVDEATGGKIPVTAFGGSFSVDPEAPVVQITPLATQAPPTPIVEGSPEPESTVAGVSRRPVGTPNANGDDDAAAADAGDDGGGGAPWLLIAGIGAGVVAIAGTGAYYWRKRQSWA